MLKALTTALSLLGAVFATGLCTPATATDEAPLRIGIAPHSSARVIVAQYQPVRLMLEETLSRPVEIVTAPDFTVFARRALNQEYDIAVTTGHQAQMLRADAGYLPLLTYKADFRAVVVTAASAGYDDAAALHGTTVLGLNPSSLVTLWGRHWLASHAAGVRVAYISAADSVARCILAGDAAAGFISLANLQTLAPELRDGLRVIARSDPLAGRVYMLNGRLAARRQAVHDALTAFAASAQGGRYFAGNALEGYRDITDAELAAMAPFANEVRQVLRQHR